MRHCEIAQDLFAAFTKADADSVRSLCAQGLEARQNNGPLMNLETLLRFALAAHMAVQDFRYEDVVRSDTPTGFVEEHTVRGTLPDGSQLRLVVCVVGDISEGRVQSLREYFDSADAMGLAKALSSGSA